MNTSRPRIDWILTLLVPVVAGAQATQPLEDVRRVAEDFVLAQAPAAGGRVHASADALDPRLRLPRCSGTPEAQLPPSTTLSARVPVGVSCAQPAWKVYVNVRVEAELPVLVLQRSMASGSAIGAADVDTRTMRVPGLSSSYVGELAQLDGRHLKRPATAGTPLTIDLLAADILVRRGQRVTLVASAGGLEVRAQGEAIQDARPDGRIRVLNLNSRKIIEGQVESRDRVRVGL